MAKRLTMFILIAMIAGIIVGITLNRTISDPATREGVRPVPFAATPRQRNHRYVPSF